MFTYLHDVRLGALEDSGAAGWRPVTHGGLCQARSHRDGHACCLCNSSVRLCCCSAHPAAAPRDTIGLVAHLKAVRCWCVALVCHFDLRYIHVPLCPNADMRRRRQMALNCKSSVSWLALQALRYEDACVVSPVPIYCIQKPEAEANPTARNSLKHLATSVNMSASVSESLEFPAVIVVQ
jgi:hypothetical protein